VSSPASAVTVARFGRYVLAGSMIMGCSPRYSRVTTRDHGRTAQRNHTGDRSDRTSVT
jgi:hypothetical protein